MFNRVLNTREALPSFPALSMGFDLYPSHSPSRFFVVFLVVFGSPCLVAGGARRPAAEDFHGRFHADQELAARRAADPDPDPALR